jgi:adenosine deaminase
MIDKHLHMSAATEPMVLFELIRENGLKIKTKDYWEFEKTTKIHGARNLDDYLSVLHILEKIQTSPKAVERSTYSCFRSSFLSGCSALELRWNPYKRCDKFSIDMDSLILSSLSGMSKAKRIFGISGTQAFCLGTDVPEVANEAILKKALAYKDRGVTTIDLAGPVKNLKSITDTGVKELFQKAKKGGLAITIHAGEELREDSEDELNYAIELMPDRMGHGVQLHRFPNLMKKVSKFGIELEICISSNLATKSIESLEYFVHVFKQFEEHKIRYSINTDATFALDTNIKREYELHEKIKEIAKNA